MARLIGGPADGLEIPDRGLPLELIRVRDGRPVIRRGMPWVALADMALARILITLPRPPWGWAAYLRMADGDYQVHRDPGATAERRRR